MGAPQDPENPNKENYDPLACQYTPARNPNALSQGRQVLRDVTKKYVPHHKGLVNLLQLNAASALTGSARMR